MCMQEVGLVQRNARELKRIRLKVAAPTGELGENKRQFIKLRTFTIANDTDKALQHNLKFSSSMASDPRRAADQAIELVKLSSEPRTHWLTIKQYLW